MGKPRASASAPQSIHFSASQCTSAAWKRRGLRSPIHKHGGAGTSARRILTEDTQAPLAACSCAWETLVYGDVSFTVRLHTRNEVCTDRAQMLPGDVRGGHSAEASRALPVHSVPILSTLHFTAAKFFLRRVIKIVEMLPGSARALTTVTKSTWDVQLQSAALGAGGLSP